MTGLGNNTEPHDTYKRHTFSINKHIYGRIEIIFYATGAQKKARVAILFSDKTNQKIQRRSLKTGTGNNSIVRSYIYIYHISFNKILLLDIKDKMDIKTEL